MIEVAEGLFVGSALDFESIQSQRKELSWMILQCAKEPWHREALGYTGRGAPKDHKEYLWAHRDRRLILNMVDAPLAAFFHPVMMEEGLNFMRTMLVYGHKVLVHCNQGNSRAPSMALIYMRRHGLVDPEFEIALEQFRSIYPSYSPGMGMLNYVKDEFAKDEPKRIQA